MEVTNKSKVYKLLSVAAIILICTYATLLVDLIAKAVDVFGEYEVLFFSIIKCLFYIAFIILYLKFAKITDFNPLTKKSQKMNLKQLLTIYAITLICIFMISFSINYNLNITFMLGLYTAITEVTNLVSTLVAYAFRIFLSFIAMAYIQEAFELIWQKPALKYVPFGSIVIFLTTGIIEFTLGISPVNLVLWFCNLVYGLIYLVSGKRFWVSFFMFIFIFLF